MSIVQDIPIGPPRVWTFAVEVVGFDVDSHWFGSGGANIHFEGSGQTTQRYSGTVTLQDVLRYELVTVVGPGGTSQEMQVRHTRTWTDPATGITSEYGDGQGGYGMIVNCNVTKPPRVTDDWPPTIPKASASLVTFGPDGQLLPTVVGPEIPISDAGGYEGSGGWTGGIGLLGDPRSGWKNIMNALPLTALQINIQARRWPSDAPIAGLDVTVNADTYIPGYIAVTPHFPTVTTDEAGNATVLTSATPIAFPPPSFQPWQGAGPFSAVARTQSLRTGALDNGQPYANSILPGNDSAGYFIFGRFPGMVRAVRASSYTLDDGTTATNWQGTARPRLNSNLGDNDLESQGWQIAQVAGGVQAIYDAARAATYKSHYGNNLTYGVKRTLSAAQGQATRNYRYLRVRLHATAASAGTLLLWTDWANPGGTDPAVSSRSLISPIAIFAGENTFEIDLVAISTDAPFGYYGQYYGQTRGWLGGYQTWNLTLPNSRMALDPANAALWRQHNPNWIGLEGLTPGETYTIEEVTLFDKPGAGRTPFRVRGSAQPAPGGTPANSLSGPTLISSGQATVRVLANGRPTAFVPSVFLDPAQNVLRGNYIDSGHILTAQELAARFVEYYDAGAGIWTLTNPDPRAAIYPQVHLQPAAITDGGFDLDGVTSHPVLRFAPYYDVTVSPTVVLRLEMGGVVEGLTFDDKSRRVGQGKSMRASIQHPPPGDPFSPAGPVSEEDVSADMDGYWQLLDLFQPQYWPPTHDLQVRYDPGAFARGYILPYLTPHECWADDDPPGPGKPQSSAGRPFVSLQDSGDPWQIVVGHRNSFFFYDLARLLRALTEQDFAQDHATGRLYRVWSDAGTGALTAEAREGWRGLAGDAARLPVALVDASGQPRKGANPSLWITHETGVCSLVYAQGDGSGPLVRALSDDHLLTLGAETMAPFLKTGGYPAHFQDNSTGIVYYFAAFDNADGTQEIRSARQNSLGTTLSYRDASTEKVVATGVPAAGRPLALPNRFDAVQSILLIHGDLRYSSPDAGETWTALT